MREAYGLAFDSIAGALRTRGQVLDCGTSAGGSYERLKKMIDLDPTRNACIEWSEPQRVIEERDTHVKLTPNIMTFFNMALLLTGKNAFRQAASGFEGPSGRQGTFQISAPIPEAHIYHWLKHGYFEHLPGARVLTA